MASFDGRTLVPDFSPLTEQLNAALRLKAKNDFDLKKDNQERMAKEAQRRFRAAGAQAAHINTLEGLDKKRVALNRLAQDAVRNGGDSKAWERLIAIENEDELNLALTQMAISATDADKFISDRLKPKEPKFSQGTGIMSGYTFDQNTGTYSIDDKTKQLIAADAAREAVKDGMLDSKKIADINDKVTGLTKDVFSIVDAAKSLEALRGRGSPAAQISAVFKFMKANDPTSTVRESELGMVFSAQGAMAGFAQYVTSLFGEGKLSDPNFEDLVNTSKTLANSAIESSAGVVGNYLDVLSDKIPEEDIKKLLDRVPERLAITETAKVKIGTRIKHKSTGEVREYIGGGKWKTL